MNDLVYILYQFDENYAPFAAVSITSLFENNRNTNIAIYAFAENVFDSTKEKLESIVKRYGGILHFLDTVALVNQLESLRIPKYRGAYATNFKLFLDAVLPEGISRIIYLDCDTLVSGNIEELFFHDMNGCSLAMVLDSLGDKHARLIGLSRDSWYVNGGVMLFDIPKWKEQRCAERIMKYAQDVRSNFPSPDQDLLNVVLNGEICILEPRYNLQPIHKAYPVWLYRFFWRWDNYYDDVTLENSIQNPVIHHCFRYLGQFPWNEGSLHPDVAEFNKYFQLSGWSQKLPQNSDRKSIVFQIERKFYKCLPAPAFLTIFRIFYDYFIWNANRKSLKNQCSKNM